MTCARALCELGPASSPRLSLLPNFLHRDQRLSLPLASLPQVDSNRFLNPLNGQRIHVFSGRPVSTFPR